MIKAILLDLDLCIFDTHSLGENVLDPVLAPLFASVIPKAVQQEIAGVLWSTSLEDVFAMFSIPTHVAQAMREAHQTLVIPPSACTYGDEGCLSEIEARRILVTSGYRSWQERKIIHLGIAKFFDEIIIDAVDDPCMRKGKKRIFKELQAKYGWRPKEVLVVGDNPHSELKAGKELGMVTVQALRPTVRKSFYADYYIESLSELVVLVK